MHVCSGKTFGTILPRLCQAGRSMILKKEREGGGGALVYGDGAWLGDQYRDMSHLSRESSKHA